jgi:hypothetical protein
MKRLILLFLLIALPSYAMMSVTMIGGGGTSTPECTAQTITWNTQPAAMTVGDADQTLDMVSSDSALDLTFTTNNSAICTIASSKLHAVGEGLCVVSANQAGNVTYCAASQANSGNVAITGTAGQVGDSTVEASSTTQGATVQVLYRAQATQSGSLSKAYVYDYDPDYGMNIKVCVYLSTSSAPVTNSTADALVGCSTAITTSDYGLSAKWLPADPPNGATMSGGTVTKDSYYWIAVIQSDAGADIHKNYTTTATAYYRVESGWLASPPATLNGKTMSTAASSGPMSVYVTTTP